MAFLANRLSIRTTVERLQGFNEETRGDPACIRLTELATDDDVSSAVADLLTGPDAPTALAARNEISVAAMRTLQRLGKQH